MRVLVTGGAGFIGSHLCERLLAQGDDVVCVDNDRLLYKGEMHAFLSAISSDSTDPRLQIPPEVIIAIAEILIYEVDRDEIRKQWGGSSNWSLYR